MARILIVDDEPSLRRILATNLLQESYEVVECCGVSEARKALADNTFDAAVTDQKMADGVGLDVLAAARESDPWLSVVFLTAFATIELAVESMRRGAFDFVAKPFRSEVLLATVKRAVEHTNLLRENDRLRDAVVRMEGSSEIRGNSIAISNLRAKIAKVAPTNATVLITGETGTGKELVARAIHRSSLRSTKSFIPVNCAAFTETLLESELFGHERGAFTGADRSREGLFEAADQGTLFLDEVGELSLAAQSKLLRVLTERQVTRVGSTKPRPIDVRLLVATHRDLQRHVREGSFREDLYYRIAVVPISIPPLRERREDIGELSELFLLHAARELKAPPRRITAEALCALQRYKFPGNVRELKNLLERASILATGNEIDAANFPVAAESGKPNGSLPQQSGEAWGPEVVAYMAPDVIDLRAFVASLEKALVQRALKATNGGQAEAARRLGLTRSDIFYKLGKYKIQA